MTNGDRPTAGAAGSPGAIIHLSLVGLHPDGEHIVLKAAGNTRFLLPISEELHAAVRGDRSRLEFLQAASAPSPREIQGRVRAGESAEDIAQSAGIPLAQVQRYERPVLDERAFVARQARAAKVGNTSDAPALGDLVTDRLAARNVETSELEWDAVKLATGGWRVSVTFVVGDTPTSAQWRFDPRTQVLSAMEDEARWLSETTLGDEPIPHRRHLSPVPDEPFDIESAVAPVYSLGATGSQPVVDTEALLDDLAARRGVRQGFEVDLDSSADEDLTASPFLPASGDARRTPGDDDAQRSAESPREQAAARVVDLHAAAPQTPSAPEPPAANATDSGSIASHGDAAPVDPGASPAHQPAFDLDEPSGEPAPVAQSDTAKSAKSRRGRSQMPTWDEIVFGAKTD